MRRSLIGAVVALAAALMLAPAASAVDDVNTKKLRKGVTAAGILDHMRALQRIANANDGTRAATTSGYDASLDYVEKRMKNAGYKVTRDEFPFAAWEQTAPALLQREGQAPYTEGPPEGGGDYSVAQFSGAGNVTAQVVTTNDIVLDPTGEPGSGNSGCEEADWGGQDLTGKIALVERGTCAFVDKIENERRAGTASMARTAARASPIPSRRRGRGPCRRAAASGTRAGSRWSCRGGDSSAPWPSRRS